MSAQPMPSTPIAILDEFLVVEEWQGLLEFTLHNAPAFRATQVIGPDGASLLDPQHRRSRVLFDLGPYHGIFSHRLMTFLPHVLQRLGRPEFGVSQLEVQLTATNHGEFFRAHIDNEANEVSGRRLTFVYFFHREPCGFQGGELRLFDTEIRDGRSVAVGPYRVVYPLQNQIVFFPSSCLHEIVPVTCPSCSFEDSRFTVNGWYHQ
jgi:Rps23 Pro-64 3,4-dihydroxylase Tpa1-like proline 4-hydroxylase